MNPNDSSQTQTGGKQTEGAAAGPQAQSPGRTPNKRKPRRWVPYVGALVLLGVIAAGLWPKPVPVETANVTEGPLKVSVNEEGRTRVRQRYTVSAPAAGQLRRPPFKAGAEVVKGKTVVAVIDPLLPALLDERARTAAEARRESVEARLAKAKAELDFSQTELRRFEKLYAEKTVSAQELDAAQLRKTAAEKTLSAAQSDLQQAIAELAEFSGLGTSGERQPVEILAPESGRVLRVFEESARSVSMGMPLLEIGDPVDLEVVVEVLSRDGAVIQPGMPVELEQWGGGEPLPARVRLVEPAGFTKVSALGVEEQRVNVIADLLAPPAQRGNLGDGFRVEASIIVWQEAKALKAPAGALFRHGDGWAAYVMENGRAYLRKVAAGKSSGAETQILSGLKSGEEVIIYPGSRIKDGLRVKQISV